MTYQIQFFNSHYCNADFPLLDTLPVLPPQETQVFTPFITLNPIFDTAPKDSPHPSIFLSEKNTFEATLMNTLAETQYPTPCQSLSISMRRDKTITYTYSEINITSETVTFLSTLVNSNYSFTTATITDYSISYIIVVTMTGSISSFFTLVVQTFQSFSQFQSFVLIEGTSNPDDSDSINLILILAGAFLLLLISGILVYYLVISDNNGDSSGSCQVMNEEIVLIVEDSPSIAVTNDNPLWTTSIMGDTDDPFRDDFEEDPNENILKGLASKV